MVKKEDRRVRITKQIISESLIGLLQEHPLAKVSVKMICEKADINRSTFYAHYKDQTDLLDSIQQEAIFNIKEHVFATSFIQQEENAAPIIVKILEYCKQNSALFKIILGDRGNTTFQIALMTLVQEKAIDEISNTKHVDEHTNKYLELFAVSGVLSMVRYWLENGCKDEPSALAELMSKFLYEGIFDLYK